MKGPFSTKAHIDFAKNANERILLLKKFSYNDFDIAHIRIAITIGDLTGIPLDISSIAETTSINRSTVRRKIAKLERAGIVKLTMVNGRQLVMHSNIGDKSWTKIVDRICEMIVDVAKKIKDSQLVQNDQPRN